MHAKTILLIEDNADDEMLTKMALKRIKIANEIVVMRDGAEALDYLFARGPFTDRDIKELPQVILLDLKLPKVDGLDVLRQIRQSPDLRRIPVVILTSSSEEQDVIRGYDLGANGFVCKPVGLEDFTKAVHELGIYWLLVNQPPP